MSEQKKYTPGPWTLTDGFDKEGNGIYMPTVHFEKCPPGELRCGICVNNSHDQEAESLMANAHLIKASLEMFEALEKFLEGWEHFCNCLDFKNTFLDAAAITWMNECPMEVAKAINSARGLK